MIASRCAVVMRGGRNPRVVLVKSRTARVLGVVVPMPTSPVERILIRSDPPMPKTIGIPAFELKNTVEGKDDAVDPPNPKDPR